MSNWSQISPILMYCISKKTLYLSYILEDNNSCLTHVGLLVVGNFAYDFNYYLAKQILKNFTR